MAAEKKKTEKKEPGIEERFARLDEILERMEAGDCPLEESFRLYEEGMKLAAAAQQQIKQVESRLEILSAAEADGDEA